MKAILRGAQCHFRLKHCTDCIEWCDRGLRLDLQHNELLKLRADAVRISKENERDERKRALAEKKRNLEEDRLLQLVKDRGIRVERRHGEKPLSLEDLEPCHPAAVQKKVHADEDGHLVWPVLFLYPEFGETDFIEEFRYWLYYLDKRRRCEIALWGLFFEKSAKEGWDLKLTILGVVEQYGKIPNWNSACFRLDQKNVGRL